MATTDKVEKNTLGSLSNKEGDGYENVTEKVNSHCFKPYHAYPISFSSSNGANMFWSWIIKDWIEVQEKKKKVVHLCSRPQQNLKLDSFKFKFCIAIIQVIQKRTTV